MGFVIDQMPYPPDVHRGEAEPRTLTTICGERTGLTALRDLIQRALDEGEAFMSDRIPNTINTGACVALMREDNWENEPRLENLLALNREHSVL